MLGEHQAYLSRRMTPEQRQVALAHRQRNRLPWHGPPHYDSESQLYLITAACYEHKHVINTSPARMAGFEADLLEATSKQSQQIFAWNVLPNHYHLLVHSSQVIELLAALGRLHGQKSYQWNLEEHRQGRKVWHRAAETAIKSDRHFWAALNYVLHNAVRHGYAESWQDWPYCNAAEYLAEVGHSEAERRWREYPVLDFGSGWDPPEL